LALRAGTAVARRLRADRLAEPGRNAGRSFTMELRMKNNLSRSSRAWQLAIACLAFSAAALVGCDRRDAGTTSTASPPASAASR
jgi:hypothetical protein